jgi:hypothetical protein
MGQVKGPRGKKFIFRPQKPPIYSLQSNFRNDVFLRTCT